MCPLIKWNWHWFCMVLLGAYSYLTRRAGRTLMEIETELVICKSQQLRVVNTKQFSISAGVPAVFDVTLIIPLMNQSFSKKSRNQIIASASSRKLNVASVSNPACWE